jgi:transketolase
MSYTDKNPPLEPLADKWGAFGWKVFEMNGHNMADIVDKLEMATRFQGRPAVIIAHTVKGMGVSFMGNVVAWNCGTPTPEQYERALAELNN